MNVLKVSDASNKLFLEDKTIDAEVKSDVIFLGRQKGYCITALISDSVDIDATISLQGSNEIDNPSEASFVTIESTIKAVTEDKNFMWNVSDAEYPNVRLFIEYNSGSAKVNARYNCKLGAY